MFGTRKSLKFDLEPLHQGAWFRSLPAPTRELIIAELHVRRVASGGNVFGQGDLPSGLHGAVEGQVHVTGVSVAGRPALIGILRPGDWVGFLACLDGAPYAFTATCVGDCTVFTLPLRAVRKIFEESIDTYKLLIAPELVASRRNYRFLLETHGSPPLQRLAERLMDLGRWPYARPQGPLSPLEQVSQDQLAAATGLSRQTVNSLLQELVQFGLIEVSRGKVRVTDPGGLGRIAQAVL